MISIIYNDVQLDFINNTQNHPLVIAGDFNIHVDDDLNHLDAPLGVCQRNPTCLEPYTHRRGDTLDLIRHNQKGKRHNG